MIIIVLLSIKKNVYNKKLPSRTPVAFIYEKYNYRASLPHKKESIIDNPAGSHGRILLGRGRFLALRDGHLDPRVRQRNHILPTPWVVFLIFNMAG